MTKFTKRTTQPSKDNKYYNSNINPFVSAGFGMFQNNGNCTCYAFGRFYELIGSKPKLSTSNAENWYGKNDGYKRGQTPKVGAVACWRKGEAGNSKDGVGHVAIVEEVKSNGDFISSESGWESFIFKNKTYKKTNGYKASSSAYHFQGFIYCPIEFEVEKPKKTEIRYVYNCEELNVRKGASTNYSVVRTIKKGTEVNVYEISGDWSRIGTNEWVSSKYLSKTKTTSYKTKKVANCSTLNVRSGAGTKYKVVRTIKKGTKVTIYKTSGDWSKISSSKEEWCSNKYLK